MAIEWSKAHEREALARTYEVAAEQIRSGGYDGDKFGELTEEAQDEAGWRRALREMGLCRVDIRREVRRVDALATGRLVRELGGRRYVVSQPGQLDEDFATPAGAASAAATRRGATAHTFRVTRIRRA